MGPVATAAYLRVSTHQQDLKLQRDAIARALKARRERVPPSLWFEDRKSGASIDRPALQKLRAAVRAGRVGRVYVFRIDRLGRSGIRDTLALVHEFRAAGAELVSLADGFDLNGPAADVVLAVLAWAAQMERNAIGERIKAARRRIEAKGGKWGRPRVVDRATIDRARALQKEGRTLRAISIALKVKRSTLADALSAARDSRSLKRASSPARTLRGGLVQAAARAVPARARAKVAAPPATRVPSRPAPKSARNRARRQAR